MLAEIRTVIATELHKAALLLLVNAEYYKVFNKDLEYKRLAVLLEDMCNATGEVVLVDDRVVAGYLLLDNTLLTYVMAEGCKTVEIWLRLTQSLLVAAQTYSVLEYKKLSPLMRLNAKVCKNNKIIVAELKKAAERGALVWEAKQKRSKVFK